MNFSAGDNNGYIEDCGDKVRRIYTGSDSDYVSRMYDIYMAHNLTSYGMVETEMLSANTLLHKKHTITYPYEWSPAMFKDAVLFHLELLLILDEIGLTLKDALPENILFEGTKPIFVDFFSLVTEKDLSKESWLTTLGYSDKDLRVTVLRAMFIPYMLIPLLCYAQKNWTQGRKFLKENFCNSTVKTVPSWSDIKLSTKCYVKEMLKQILHKNTQNQLYLFEIQRRLESLFDENIKTWQQMIIELRSIVTCLDISIPPSGYIDYYAAKNENYALYDKSSWRDKQLSVYDAIHNQENMTVLDIGCNTGWFSQMAAVQQLKVRSCDIDMACVDKLYQKSKFFQHDIVPLWLTFDELTHEGFSLDAKGVVQENPLHMAATKRMQSDIVLCLGLLHHLTLGMGKNYEEVISVLAKLTQKTLVLEFVEIDDPLIKNDPSFFPHLSDWTPETASKKACRNVLNLYYTNVFEQPSSETRCIFVANNI